MEKNGLNSFLKNDFYWRVMENQLRFPYGTCVRLTKNCDVFLTIK
jgi:hypothetical protein